MESSKKKLRKKRAFHSLLPNFESPEGNIQSELKNLYSILVKLSSNAQGSHQCNLKVSDDGGIKLKFGDICELSNLLFQKLDGRFEQLFSHLSAAKDLGESGSSFMFNAVEVLNFLFRCCMFLLPLLAEQHQILMFEKGFILFKILRKLLLPNSTKTTGKHAYVFEESVFHERAAQDSGCSTSSLEGFSASIEFLEPCNPLLSFKCKMLEIFIDELLAHRQVMGCLKMINSIAATDDVLFTSHSTHGDAGILMEAISNHFMQSFSDKQVFGDFLSRLFCTHTMKLKHPFRPPALGMTAAVALFLNPITASAPKYIQAHLISLVSEAVHIKNVKPDPKLTNCFLSTFEKSVSLYTRHMAPLQTDGWGSASSSPHDIVNPPFEFYISREMKEKVGALISRLDSSSNEVFEGSVSKMKSDLVGTSLRFVKDCENAYMGSCQEEILTILSCLVLKASESYNDKSLRPLEGATLQHLYLLASLLKLMSISLLQAIRCVQHSGDLSCLRSLKDFSSCKEYDFILGTIAHFKDFDVSLPLQRDLLSSMSSHSMKHTATKMMFLHFSGLMSLSFANGLDCLVKACLLTNLALLNLFVFEEGNLDALHLLVDSSGDYSSSELLVVRFQESESVQRSSLVVASRFHEIRSLHSSTVGNKHNECSQTLATALDMEASACLEEETEETCSGEIFLKSMLQKDVSDFDDLVDFIECKQGKDYTSWLKNRETFRKWRSNKIAVLKWKRKKKSWKTVKGREMVRLPCVQR